MSPVTSRERKVRMPRAQVRFQSDRKRRFLNPFVKLKKMRMTGTDSDPDYFRGSFWRKCSNSFDRQKK